MLHVGHDMNEKEKNDRLRGAVCYEDEIMMEFKQEYVEIRRLIEERRSTPKEEKQRLKEVNKRIKKCIRDKKE